MGGKGSSPLSRGILTGLPRPSHGRRIIPALAGNTPPEFPRNRSGSDHPRSRGEYDASKQRRSRLVGSSPLSRGIRRGRGHLAMHGGIIPALAGNTVRSMESCCWSGDHPRSRGEYSQPPTRSSSPLGSSPLSRGIPGTAAQTELQTRIIPALAGNTLSGVIVRCPGSDHPRSRGEYRSLRSLSLHCCGSSPLSRGIRHVQGQPRLVRRIIPALAGNTGTGRALDIICTDHPRSRGEYRRLGPHHSRGSGSSPLSRGIRSKNLRLKIDRRIIPALAGNTVGC